MVGRGGCDLRYDAEVLKMVNKSGFDRFLVIVQACAWILDRVCGRWVTRWIGCILEYGVLCCLEI